MPDEKKSNDDLADALSKLASGEAPSAPDGIPSEQVSLNPDPSKRKRSAAPPTTNVPPSTKPIPPVIPRDRAATPSARPNAPGVQPPSPKPGSVAPRKPSGAVKPPKPVRPSAPELSPAPAGPAVSARVDPSDVGSSLANVIDDDDRVNMPAPGPAVFSHRPAATKARPAPIYARLTFRRTIIPILLTMGIALPGCAVWWAMQDEDSPLKSLGVKFPLTFVGLGLVMLALAIVNMIQVKNTLAEKKAASGR